jgi:hypothetical protein
MGDVENKSAAYRIFHWYYKAFLPQYALYSRDYLENFGIPTTQNREIDRELSKTLTLCQVTISDMAEHLDNGVNIRLEDPKTSVEIYKTVREHLMDWDRIVRDSVGDINPPLDDLRKLDRLAVELYKIAKGYFEQAPSDSKLFQAIDRLESRRAISRKPLAALPEHRKVQAEHTLITDSIAKEVFAKSRRWR